MKNENQFNNENPLFFVFTCIKDGRAYVERLFKSLLNQTKINFVHYIYDDGSNDPIDDLVELYKQSVLKLKHPYKVIYERNEKNIGLNKATQHCISKCNLPYFIWIDCDNWVNKDFFKEMEKGVSDSPCIIRSSVALSFGKGNRKKRFSKSLNPKYSKYIFFSKQPYYYSFFAINKKYYGKIKNNDLLDIRRYYNDEQVLAQCYFSNFHSVFCKKAISYQLFHGNNESIVTKDNARKNDLYMYNYRIEYAKNCSKEEHKYYLFVKDVHEVTLELVQAVQNKNKKLAKKELKKLKSLSSNYDLPMSVLLPKYNYFLWFLFVNCPRIYLCLNVVDSFARKTIKRILFSE